jgi:4-amino-4-deoxy-L-arabinose transferase-like glycosyltransferase
MPFLTQRKDLPTTRLAQLGVLALCAIWLLAGVFGHDPWKNDDALHLGAAFGMNKDNWLVPRIAGDPWLASPPLYHWVAALCGKLFGWLMPWHDAARLASSVFAAALLAMLARTASTLFGPSAGLAAPMMAIGTLGLLVPLHDAQPAIVTLTGFAVTLFGLLQWRQRPVHGGLIVGAGIGLCFLGTGLAGTVVPATVTALVQLHPAWRTQRNHAAGLVALAVAAMMAFPWPWLLHQHSSVLFDLWWFAELSNLSAHESFTLRHLELMAWASWPVLPLALWTVWLERRRLWQPPTLLPLTAALVALLHFLVNDPKLTSLLPALVPLTLLAATGAGRLKRGAANAFDWFGMMTFTLLSGLIWLGGIAILTGEPARVAKNFSKPAPDFVAMLSVPALLLAIAASVGWIVVMVRTPRSPWRAAARWSVGMTTVWVLLIALWLPWIDHGKTYRSVSVDFSQALAGYDGCIARRNLGLAQRASLDYFSGIRTVSRNHAQHCRFMIVQARQGAEKTLPGWRAVLATSRPGDKSEEMRLYRRAD